MTRVALVGVLLGSLALAATAQAQDDNTVIGGGDPVDGSPKTMVVGAYADVGMAMASFVRNYPYCSGVRFAGGGGAYFDGYLTPMLALEGGIGFVGKGHRYTYLDEWGDHSTTTTEQLVYMEIPLGAKLNIKNFQASLLFALNFALLSRTKSEGSNQPSNESEWDFYDLGQLRRFNIGPKIVLGWPIPIGPVSVVPGFYWSMHLINELKDTNWSLRAMNFMFRLALEFGF